MRARVLASAILVALLLAGCGRGAPNAPSSSSKDATATGTTAESSGESRGPAVYEALTAETAGEKKAVASIGVTYKTYLANMKQAVAQNPSTVVYADGDTVRPQLIGYRVVAYTAKKANGKFGSAALLVLNGVVTADAAWDRAGEARLSDINAQYFVYEIPSIFDTPLPATSAREKDAVAKVRAWCDANLADKSLERFDLAGYTFAWGQGGDDHALLMSMRPDNPQSYVANAK